MPRRKRKRIPISETIRILIGENTKPLKTLAADAGVDYHTLRRWVRRETDKLDADAAEALYRALTGKRFSE